jgi:CheY-like chemotaxis protein
MTTFPITPQGRDHVLVASPSMALRQRVVQSVLPKARRVEQASGGAEALDQLEKGFWQVLFLDRRLPDLDAEELSQTVRARFPAVEVVFLDQEAETPASATESGEASEFAFAGERLGDCRVNEPGLTDENDFLASRVRNEGQCPKPARASRAAALPGMIGGSAAMQAVYRIRRSSSVCAPR